MTTKTRKWTATLSVGGQEFDVQKSVNDTLLNQTREAVELARSYISMEMGSDAAVVLYKTTQAGTVRHSSRYVYRDYDGKIKVQR